MTKQKTNWIGNAGLVLACLVMIGIIVLMNVHHPKQGVCREDAVHAEIIRRVNHDLGITTRMSDIYNREADVDGCGPP